MLPKKELQRTADVTAWLTERKAREEGSINWGVKGEVYPPKFLRASLHLASWILRLPLLNTLARHMATRIVLKPVDLYWARSKLPPAFNGFKILHFSDLHLDILPKFSHILETYRSQLVADLLVMTGDFRDSYDLNYESIRKPLSAIVNAVRCPEGKYAVLGNHDSYSAVEFLESVGLTPLINETISIPKKGDQIHLTGLDDVYCFYSQYQEKALEQSPEGFKIALVHSPDFIEQVARYHYALYLTGHTHGGQICLPGKIPILKRSVPGKLISGQWQHAGMTGYTNPGFGCSTLPLRLFCPGEITLFTLKYSQE